MMKIYDSKRRAPSQARLEDAFPGHGRELRALLSGALKTTNYTSVQQLERECYHRPSYAHRVMTAVNEIIGGYGVETIRDKHGNGVADYINLGETYTVTIIRKIDSGSILIKSWGDFVESNRL